MKIAYLINCHKNMEHVARLARVLHSENGHVFIHVDKKTPQNDYDRLCSLTSDLEYCYVSETRLDCKLDNRSLVDVVFVLISDAKRVAKQNSISYSYYSNMSGQDYLIKPKKLIEEELENNYPSVYMLFRDNNTASWVAKKFNRNKALISYRDWALGFKNRIIRKILQMIGVILRKVLKLFGQTASQRVIKNGWEYYQGPAWWVLPDCVVDALEEEYYNPSKFGIIMIDESTTPEETYFQSMIKHLFFSEKAKYKNFDIKIQNCMTYADFGSEGGRTPVFHPYVMTMDDYDTLCNSDCWFARKFDASVDSNIIDQLDKTLL